MRKAGKDGLIVQTAISRLCELFKVNHFSEKPSECSLITFGIVFHELSSETQRIITIAESRSLLIRIKSGHQDKNHQYERSKFQINKMLSPRWDLPISRRGVVEFSAKDLEVIFDCEKHSEDEFKKLLNKWQKNNNIENSKITQLELL